MSFNYTGPDGAPLVNVRSEIVGSSANGPGSRYVVWFQGCGHGCVGCYNPGSWSSTINTLVRPEVLAERILSSSCTGVTFTGGEPMAQGRALLDVLRALHVDGELAAALVDGILVFSGHEMMDLIEDRDCAYCLPMLDVIIMGRFKREQRSVRGLLGSTNQRVWWNPSPVRGRAKIEEDSITKGQVFETHMSGSGVVLTGFPEIEGLKIPGLRRG